MKQWEDFINIFHPGTAHVTTDRPEMNPPGLKLLALALDDTLIQDIHTARCFQSSRSTRRALVELPQRWPPGSTVRCILPRFASSHSVWPQNREHLAP